MSQRERSGAPAVLPYSTNAKVSTRGRVFLGQIFDAFFDHYICIIHYIMLRRPLKMISANISREEELTLYTRSKITTLHEDDDKIRDILR